MTLMHPARTGSPIAVWFVDGVPVRLLSGGERYRVVDVPKCADINGCRYWRVRAHADDGGLVMLDLRATDDGWVLAGADDAG